jgi:hypothetical protein
MEAGSYIIHEKSYLEYLTKSGLEVVKIEGVEVTNATVTDTGFL